MLGVILILLRLKSVFVKLVFVIILCNAGIVIVSAIGTDIFVVEPVPVFVKFSVGIMFGRKYMLPGRGVLRIV